MSNQANLSSLFAASGLDQNAVTAMDLTADNLGPAIMDGLGTITLDDISTSEVMLVKLVMDDSGSMTGNVKPACDGHNAMIRALRDSKSAATILVSCEFLNRGVLYPYVPLDQAVLMNSRNYVPAGGTPLYERTATALTGTIAKATEFEQGGVAVRGVTFVVTDGASTDHRTRVSDVASIVQALLRTESYIVGGMGIDDGYTDFRQVFAQMGVRPEWILTPANTDSEIRRAFGTISQSAVRASQAAGTFSATALGGFGN